MTAIKVTLKGFDVGQLRLRGMARRFPVAVNAALKSFGDDGVRYLQEHLLSNGFDLPEKARHDGNPPLVDKKIYLWSWRAEVSNRVLTIWPDGDNTHMSNLALSELLEWGSVSAGVPPKPHIRPWTLWMVKSAPKLLGERIVDALLSDK